MSNIGGRLASSSRAMNSITRRGLHRRMAGLGLGLGALQAGMQSALAAGDLSYMTWPGYDLPEFHQAYIDTYGRSPDVSYFADEEEGLVKVRSGFTPDLIHSSTYATPRFFDSDVLQPIDISRLTHWQDLWPQLTGLDGVAFDGETYVVPFEWGTSSIVYRTDLVDGNDQSWDILFDEQYAGRIANWNSIDGPFIVAAMVAGVEDPFAMTEDEITRTRELLEKQRDLTRFYWDDQTTLEQALASGEVVASYGWSSSMIMLRDQGVPIGYMAAPKEGILTWVGGIMIHKDADADMDEMYDFINAMTSPETGAALIEAYGYGHANRKAFDLVSPERLTELGLSTPEKLLSEGVFLKEIDPALREKYQRIWDEVRAGM